MEKCKMSFEEQKNELARICRELLNAGDIKLILGFAKGENGLDAVPLFARNQSDIDAMVWNETCTPNLAKYLLDRKEKTAVIAKPCDSRAITMYLIEKQLNRDNIYIIGVECAGMKGKNGKPAPGCDSCSIKVPPIYDVLVKGDKAEAEKTAEGEKEKLREKLAGSMERFRGEVKKCILCFSCRQACYGCYCKSCFVERNIPNWLPADPDIGSKMLFHLGRTMHLAGRCVECGACERVCPSGVKLRYLAREISDLGKELYGYDAGMNPEEIPSMSAFSQNDREVGFLGGDGDDSCCDCKKQV